MTVTPGFRTEHDLIGDLPIPLQAYYGVHSLRAVENFPISGQSLADAPDLITALAAIKEAAAQANMELGLLNCDIGNAIVETCREIRNGSLHDQFVVDLIQGGAGTSTNMNANEVIANRALEILGHDRGEYRIVSPNDHVNLSQSTNDVYPTALKLACGGGIGRLMKAMSSLRMAFATKADEFAGILKMGRTQLQDAVPMTLGQEFGTYEMMLKEDEARLSEAVQLIREINLGATAIGTGINSHPDFAAKVRARLSDIVGIELITSPNLIEATQDCGAFVQISGVLKRVAVKLSKTCNDLRLLSSGPRAGFNEINLPPRQAGSSIMPGKVNPVIPEVVNQVAFEVIGNDVSITMAAEAGQLQLNAFEPIIFYSLSRSINHLTAACSTLEANCVIGITANTERLRGMVEQSIGIATALNPYIGYRNATEIAVEAQRTGRSVYDLVLEKRLMSKERLVAVLLPEMLTRPQLLPASEAAEVRQ